MAETNTPAASGAAWALEARGLGKRYRRGWALRDCSFRLPAGRICGLVGPNGAGKSTLLGMATRQVVPTEGELRAFGVPVSDPATMPRYAFLAQDKPLFKRFTVAESLRMGAELNPGWDMAAAERIVCAGGIPMEARTGTLSGGQRTRVAFALAFGKRPDLLLLDEPMSDLDPLARDEMSTLLMAEAVERGTTVVMSSHMLTELEDMCDYLLVLSQGRVRMAGDADALVPAHRMVTGVAENGALPAALLGHTVVESRIQGRQFQAMVRTDGPLGGGWQVSEPSLEEVLLAHLRSPDVPALYTPGARTEAEGATTV
ncbi:ABC transporter ATP-binding protein [Streptomyces nitrosporeus]|uniref:ABC transporter ATP-binding protein n=1 Tax=Streptomyces nitrosporeus TaxID=28894 RepID=A0A5J6FB51_9ACTN|nr:ABC transporter ATP-binding protein [Streptomyces nitrosporeus]QEU72200.1 ABC transporter ATP-binding protein [Streptomyces nitrosporeus]GGY79724.1 ABC transporter ATP-binding protein [Streptomyces nitrosporeus]